MASELLSLRCWVVGDPPGHGFTVEISKSKDISILKQTIKKVKKRTFKDADVSDVDVWAVKTPLNHLGVDTTKVESDASGDPLQGLLLGDVDLFKSPGAGCLHVVVRKPGGTQ